MRRLNKFSIFIPLAVLLTVCKNVDSVKPTDRVTFIKVYEKGNNYSAQVAEALSDGYIMGSNYSHNLGSDAYVTRTDLFGNVIWETKLKASSIVSIKVLPAGGYLVYGDGIHTNDKALSVNDRVVSKAKITRISADGAVSADSLLFYAPGDSTTDFHGTGITLDGAGNIVTSGTMTPSSGSAFTQSFVVVYPPAGTAPIWSRLSPPETDQNVVNGKNVFTNHSGAVILSTSIEKVNLSQTLSYVTLPTVDSASGYSNYALVGQSNGVKLSTVEMQSGFGEYGIVGTLSDGQGKSGNIFFIRVGVDGTFKENSIIILDGAESDSTKAVVARGAAGIASVQSSATEDVGLAVSSSPDGGYLIGGTMTSTLARGNGGLDVWLVKIDVENHIIWNKVFGGSGDETVNSIRPLNDGSFIVAGGVTTNGLTSAFLMRIDANGEITK